MTLNKENMKKVNITYFKESGKYYTSEEGYIPQGIKGYTELKEALRNLHELKGMTMVVEDSGDGKEPYIVPHLYHPLI